MGRVVADNALAGLVTQPTKRGSVVLVIDATSLERGKVPRYSRERASDCNDAAIKDDLQPFVGA